MRPRNPNKRSTGKRLNAVLLAFLVSLTGSNAHGEKIDPASRGQLVRSARQKAGGMVALRSRLDERVWPILSAGYTTTEAAKLLTLFFRGDGTLHDVNVKLDDDDVRSDFAMLRKARVSALETMIQIASIDAENPKTALIGAWDVTRVRGAGGIAADALEIYDPDFVGRKFVATNDGAALVTGGAFWLFDASYPDDSARDTSHGADFTVVVRGNTVYHAQYTIDGKTAKLHISPMNTVRPANFDNEPHDGSFVLLMKRAK